MFDFKNLRSIGEYTMDQRDAMGLADMYAKADEEQKRVDDENKLINSFSSGLMTRFRSSMNIEHMKLDHELRTSVGRDAGRPYADSARDGVSAAAYRWEHRSTESDGCDNGYSARSRHRANRRCERGLPKGTPEPGSPCGPDCGPEYY